MVSRGGASKRLLSAVVKVRNYSAPADRSIPAAKQKYVSTSGTYPKGFLAGSAFAGVKASNTKYDDLALVVSETRCPASATFTMNLFRAAPVQFSHELLVKRVSNGLRGVVVNSGCANAVTGVQGREHAETMAKATDREFNTSDSPSLPTTLVMSTGVIGQKLPIDRITEAIPKLKANLGNTHEHWMNAANAICTTDTFPKLLSRQFTLPSSPETKYSIAGMTKGAGMIHPNMATLLAIVCTDVKVNSRSMRYFLNQAVSRSFNCISIDGDTSTNDTVAFFANGAAAPAASKSLSFRDESMTEDIIAFRTVLTEFLQDLAKLVVRDGEGATKFVTIRVKSSLSETTARRVAVSIARSALVKTALYGKDANWGRILCAVGHAPGVMPMTSVPVDFFKKPPKERTFVTTKIPQLIPDQVSVSFLPTDGSEELKLVVRGEPQDVDEVRAKAILEMEDLEIVVNLEDTDEAVSKHEVVFWTTDLSHEYVTINGDYRT